MALREAEGPPGPPWNRRLLGRLDELVVESEVLAGNPLGDPARRPLYVYVPPKVDESRPCASVYVIQGMTGQLDMWSNRTAFEPTMLERVDYLFSSGDCPPAIVVFVDAWTSYGGSQFINSASTGRYMDYLCDEAVAFVDERYPTAASRDHRGLTGKSSGGYGAMVVPMLRPDVFGALASHAGDALFEVCYQPEFPKVARLLRDKYEGSWEIFFERFRAAETLDFGLHMDPLNSYAMGACYSPDEEEPGKALLPFDVATGRLDEDIWRRWLAWDPVRLAPEHGEALASMKRIYLDAGKSDEWYLDLGAQAFAEELDKLGVEYTLDLFEGTHMGIQYRYPGAIAELARALSPEA
ncbi:MAG: alpha/beta hydrolase-fold protein [Actinomycetota bacterium]|nr:alpha/beta hydrolase-fold protein [Actinomycetota bacterium]MDQ5830041.1 alpha/beta hydrolase-fold protein [Actinomycetota bacterium]